MLKAFWGSTQDVVGDIRGGIDQLRRLQPHLDFVPNGCSCIGHWTAMSIEGQQSSERADQYSLEMAIRVAAWLAAAIFFAVAAFQAALVIGAPWGEYTQGGGTSGALASSGRLFAAVSCVLSIVMAGAILARAGEGPLQRLPARVVTVLAWVATVYSAVAVVLNLITRSTAERALWAPVSIVLLLLVATVMVTTTRRT